MEMPIMQSGYEVVILKSKGNKYLEQKGSDKRGNG